MSNERKQATPLGSRRPQRKPAIIFRKTRDLKLDPSNPRLHSERQIKQLAGSIKAFGFNVPVLVDSNLRVIAGHGRIRAAEKLGCSEIPTILLDHLTEPQARAFMIADNRLSEIAVWDDRLLAEQLKQLSVLELDFSLEATGFEMGEIDLRIESLNQYSGPKDDSADRLAERGNLPAITRPGDLWLLGQHRVYCGSALDPNSYAALMDGRKAAAIISDVPYNLRISGNVSLAALKCREFPMASGEMSEAEFREFLTNCCSLFAQHSLPGALHYLFIDWRHLAEMLSVGFRIYSAFENLCVWAKDAAGMGSFYRSQHELICVFRYGRERHRNNIQLGQFGRNRSNLWSYPRARSFARKSEEANLTALHPTVKPVALIADAIMDCSSRRDIVLDGFLGSGTTVIAAERTYRRCYGIELDPLYVDVILRRWQDFTRSAGLHAHTGKSFDEIQTERAGGR
jgi:DNA modification methylase